MKRALVIAAVFFTGLFLYGCKGGEDYVVVPSDILSPDSMAVVLVDFHLVEAALLNKQKENQNPHLYCRAYYNMIMKKHGINEEDFNKAMDFYSNHPKLYMRIYDNVLTKLSEMEVR